MTKSLQLLLFGPVNGRMALKGHSTIKKICMDSPRECQVN